MAKKKKFSVNNLDAHHKLYASLAVSTIIFVSTIERLSGPTHFMVTWLGYTLTSIFLSLLTMFLIHPAEMHRDAHKQDANKTLVFLFAVLSSLASLFAMLILQTGTKKLLDDQLTLHILLSLSCVISSWLLVHIIFTFRYAHFFYCDIERDNDGQHDDPGGLVFPNESEPDYLDFAYFSFVIGMTSQVSDVQIQSKQIRRLALVHGLLAFAFNTVIVALSINIVAGLMEG